ncbi:unnamed protein product [Arctogadus glacialis]
MSGSFVIFLLFFTKCWDTMFICILLHFILLFLFFYYFILLQEETRLMGCEYHNTKARRIYRLVSQSYYTFNILNIRRAFITVQEL